MSAPAPAIFFLVSDGSGGTCERLVKSALVQYRGLDVTLVRRPEVRTARQIRSIVKEAESQRAIVFYTLVSDATRRAMRRYTRETLVVSVDLLGPTLRALHDFLQLKPRFVPGLYYESEKEQLDRIDAIDFTLKHDDGLRSDEVGDADVVLVGVSRAAKSSTCFYLAYEGVRAANIPIVPGIDPPEALVRMDRHKVIGLTVNVPRLQSVREARVSSRHLGDMGAYLDRRTIATELREANRMMDRHGWRRIDVSFMAIEEIAKEVRRLLAHSRKRTI